MAQGSEYRYWAFDANGNGVVDADGLNGPVIGDFPINPGDIAEVFTRPLLYLGSDGAGGGIFRDETDGSHMHVSDTTNLDEGASLPPIVDEPLQLGNDTAVDEPNLFAQFALSELEGEPGVRGGEPGVPGDGEDDGTTLVPSPDKLFDLTITFKSEDAAFENSFGYYFENSGVGVLATADSNLLTPGEVVFSGQATQQMIDSIGFFLIPNGNDLNFDLDGRTGRWIQVVETEDGAAIAPLAGDPLNGAGASALFSDPGLNPGDLDHFLGDEEPSLDYMLEIEDVAGGGDLDFNDAVFRVQISDPDIIVPEEPLIG